MAEENEVPAEQPDEVRGRAKGGKARAKALSEEDRKAIAKKGALARWGPKATHRGNFKNDFGIDVDCYVLDDEQKTAVISLRGMGDALGLPYGGTGLTRFLKGSRIAPFVGAELVQKLENPLIFQSHGAALNPASPRTYGYDVTILIDICKVIMDAEAKGVLLKRQANVARQAHIILGASAKAGIKGLVYALAGYEPSKEEVIQAFKMYVREEAREYEKEFPDQLYREWFRLYQLPQLHEHKKPWKFKQLTINQVYRPLARSNGKILHLAVENRAASGKARNKIHQFLSEVGVKALRQHLGQLLGIAQVSTDKVEYEKHVTRIFGGQLELF